MGRLKKNSLLTTHYSLQTEKGLSSMSILIIVVLSLAIAWEINVYKDKFFSGESTATPAAKLTCATGIPGDCNPDEGLGPIYTGVPVCKSGNPNDCNDSKDSFLFNE